MKDICSDVENVTAISYNYLLVEENHFLDRGAM
jgi:hypothetical protein